MSPVRAAAWKKQVFGSEPVLKPEARIRRQVDGIESYLGLKFRDRVLDLGCGAGSQTLELARRSYRIVGIDSTSSSFAGAREQAKSEDLTVHFQANDLRKIPYDAEFNAVINLRNPIGVYKKKKDDVRCLEAVAGSLKSSGRLLLDLLNREWLIRRLGSQGQSFDLRTGRLDCRGFQPRGGRRDASSDSLRIYSLTEVEEMLADSGFALREVWGGYASQPYGVESQRMIVLAETKALPKKRARVDDGLPRAVRIKGRGK